ncbi:MAG: EamA family transporter [Methanoregula sp.]|jgi:drug/metabolite transporter (DMT)-like permease
MLWIFLALLGALANAAYFIIVKKYITALDPKLLTGIGFTLGGCLLFLMSDLQGFPAIGPDFFTAVAITTILNILGISLIIKALSSSDLSLSVTMLSFTPAILIGTSYIILHEAPSWFGVAGICIIVSGSYVLNISAEHGHYLDPVKAMFRNRGSWYMLIVAFLFAVSINFDKIALLNSDPFFGMALTVTMIGIAFLVISTYSGYTARKSAPVHPFGVADGATQPARAMPFLLFAGLCFLIDLFAAIEAASVNVAYTLQIVPYVIAIKRMSIIFMVLYGTLVFSEGDSKKRILGAALMVAGAIIILLFA